MREAEAYVIVALSQGGFLGFLPFLEPGVVSSTPTVSSVTTSLTYSSVQLLGQAHQVLEGSLQLFARGKAAESEERARWECFLSFVPFLLVDVCLHSRTILSSLFLDGHGLSLVDQV